MTGGKLFSFLQTVSFWVQAVLERPNVKSLIGNTIPLENKVCTQLLEKRNGRQMAATSIELTENEIIDNMPGGMRVEFPLYGQKDFGGGQQLVKIRNQ